MVRNMESVFKYNLACPSNDMLTWWPLYWQIDPATGNKTYIPLSAYGYSCRESVAVCFDPARLPSGLEPQKAIDEGRVALLVGAAQSISSQTQNLINKGSAKNPGTVEEAIQGIKLGVAFLNKIEKKAKWEQTTLTEAIGIKYMLPLDGNGKPMPVHASTWWLIEGDKRWFSNTYMLSMYQLIIRLFFMLSVWRIPELPKRITGWKTTFELLKEIDEKHPAHYDHKKPRPGDLNHYRITYKYWLPLMLNYNEIFGGITPLFAFNTANFKNGAYMSVNGIYTFATGKPSLIGVADNLKKHNDAMLKQYDRLVLKKQIQVRKVDETQSA